MVNVPAFIKACIWSAKEFRFLEDFYKKNPQHLKTYLEYLNMVEKDEWHNFVEDYLYECAKIAKFKYKNVV